MKSLLKYIKEDVFDINKNIRKSMTGEPVSESSYISEINGNMVYIQSKSSTKPLINFKYETPLDILRNSLFKEFHADSMIIEPCDIRNFTNMMFSAKKEINFHNYTGWITKNIKLRAPRVYLRGGWFENLSSESAELHVDVPSKAYDNLLTNCDISTDVLEFHIPLGGFFGVSKELLQFINRSLYQQNLDFFKELSLFKNSKFDKKLSIVHFNNVRLESSNSPKKNLHIVFKKKPAIVDYDINKDWGMVVINSGGVKPVDIKKFISNYSNILE